MMKGHSSSSSKRNQSHMSSSAPQLKPAQQLGELTHTRSNAHTHMQRPRHGIRAKDGGWDTSPHAKLPEYNSDLDPHCPRAVVREYNKTKKLNAIVRSKKGKGASDWIENTIKKKFEDIPIRETPTLREKAVALAAVEKESVAEVDILQSIIIRENLIKELESLLKFQSDIDSVLNEAVEIVKAVRFQTLDIVELIFAWKSKQKAQTRQFFYRGQNYLLKMMEDTSFLDNYDELGEYFGFYFSGNPLMYSGVPENEMPSLLHENTGNTPLFKPSAVDRNSVLIDGLSESRIRAAENIVFKEHAMVIDGNGTGHGTQHQQAGGPPNQHGSLAIGEGNMYESMVGDAFAGGQSSFQNSHNDYGDSHDGQTQQQGNMQGMGQGQSSSVSVSSGKSDHSKPRKGNKGTKVTSLLNVKSQKKARIKKLKEEIEELQAMRCHVIDQVDSLVEEHGVFTQQHVSLERRRAEAIALENAALSKRLGVEISMLEGELSHRASEVKNHQRQSYFLQQEMTRRKGLIKVLLSELADMDKKAGAKKKLMKIQKKDGIYAALIKVNSVVDEQDEEDKKEVKEQSEEKEEEVQVCNENELVGDEFDVVEEEPEPQVEASLSVFSSMEMMEASHSGVVLGTEQSTGDVSMQSENIEDIKVNEVVGPPEERLPSLPVANADRVIDDVNAIASSVSNFAVSSSLEMLWFVMGAAEEVRPAKIATRGFVQDCVDIAVTNLACSRVVSEEVVLSNLLVGFERATKWRVKQDYLDMRNNLITDFVDSSMVTAFNVAVNIISHEAVAKKDRAAQRIKVFSNELATKMVSGVFNSVMTAVVVKHELERLELLRIYQEKQQRIIDEVESVCDEFSFGAIGAALYTVENKVMRYKRAMDFEKERSKDPNSVGVMVHPAGAGFALAKMIKQKNRPVELEMYDIDAKTGVKHTFPSVMRSNGDPTIEDLLNEALENTGDDYGRVMFGKEIGVIHQTEVEHEDWVFDARLLQDVDQVKLVALCSVPGFERSITFVLTKEQENDLENTRNPSNFIKFILISALRD